jgi:hypothetical protein
MTQTASAPTSVGVFGLVEEQENAMKGLSLTLPNCCMNNIPFGMSAAIVQIQWQLQKHLALDRLNNWVMLHHRYTLDESRECFRQLFAILREDGRFSHLIMEVKGAFPEETRGLYDD